MCKFLKRKRASAGETAVLKVQTDFTGQCVSCQQDFSMKRKKKLCGMCGLNVCGRCRKFGKDLKMDKFIDLCDDDFRRVKAHRKSLKLKAKQAKKAKKPKSQAKKTD